LRSAIFSRWAECDPATAMARAQATPDVAQRQSAIDAVLHGWAYSDVDQLAGWVAKLPVGDVRDRAVAALLTQWIVADP
jgi:hypothetical protein